MSARFPDEMPCRITITFHDGAMLTKEKRDYQGFHTRPLSSESAMRKFDSLTEGRVSPVLRDAITEIVADLETLGVSRLTRLLAQVSNNRG
ncbi:MAG: hypothetical protein ACREP6_00060 [Candidatus Binataceae bacterium]